MRTVWKGNGKVGMDARLRRVVGLFERREREAGIVVSLTLYDDKYVHVTIVSNQARLLAARDTSCEKNPYHSETRFLYC